MFESVLTILGRLTHVVDVDSRVREAGWGIALEDSDRDRDSKETYSRIAEIQVKIRPRIMWPSQQSRQRNIPFRSQMLDA